MFELIRNVFIFIKYNGFVEFMRRLFKWAAKPFYESVSKYIFTLEFPSPILPSDDLNIKELYQDDSEKIYQTTYLKKRALSERLEQGDRCFAALENDKIASFFWSHFGYKDFNEIHWSIYLSGDEAWFYNAITQKFFRGKNLYPNIICYMARKLSGEDFKRAFIDIDERNTSSIRGVEKAGCSPIALIRMRKIFSKIKYRIKVFNTSCWVELSSKIENYNNLDIVVEAKICQ